MNWPYIRYGRWSRAARGLQTVSSQATWTPVADCYYSAPSPQLPSQFQAREYHCRLSTTKLYWVWVWTTCPESSPDGGMAKSRIFKSNRDLSTASPMLCVIIIIIIIIIMILFQATRPIKHTKQWHKNTQERKRQNDRQRMLNCTKEKHTNTSKHTRIHEPYKYYYYINFISLR